MDIKVIKNEIMGLNSELRALLFNDMQSRFGENNGSEKKSQIDRHYSIDPAKNEDFNYSEINNTLAKCCEYFKNEVKKPKDVLKNIQEENELLLMQLHIVQEELEMYYLANQELISAIKKSRKFINTTRKLLTNRAGKAY